MEIVDFNVGSQPWDFLQPPYLERDGTGASRGWTDQLTKVSFEIVQGRMFLSSLPNYPTNRWLVFHRTVKQARAVLSIQFSTRPTYIRFKLACDLVGPVSVRYYGRAPEQDLIEERRPPVSTVLTAVEYDRMCWPVAQVVIASADLTNSIDDVEFGSQEPFGWSKSACQLSRVAHNLGKSLGNVFGGRE
jgi:hypothetical protein